MQSGSRKGARIPEIPRTFSRIVEGYEPVFADEGVFEALEFQMPTPEDREIGKKVEQLLLDHVSEGKVEMCTSTGILVQYELDPKNPGSRKTNKAMLKEWEKFLIEFMKMGALSKSQIVLGMIGYNKKIGNVIGTTKVRIMDQAWALKRMVLDVQEISHSMTTGARTAEWMKGLVTQFRKSAETKEQKGKNGAKGQGRGSKRDEEKDQN